MRTIACALALGLVTPCLAQAHPQRAGQPPVVATVVTDGAPCGGAVAAGSVWVAAYASSRLVRIDPATNAVTGHVRVGASPCGLVAAAGSLWTDGFGTGTVERVDPARLKVVKRI